MNLYATYGGTVEAVADPLKLGRVKVRVPHVYGVVQGRISGYVATNDLPWALPAGLPAGGRAASGGFSHLPAVGDHVFVRFLDGEPEKPIWEWGMQTLDDAVGLPLHAYDETDGIVGEPKRAGWTRYSHVVELNEGGLLLTTSQGYRTLYTDSSAPGANDGKVTTATPNGSFIELDDASDILFLNSVGEINLNAAGDVLGQSDSFQWNTATDDIELVSGNDFVALSSGDTTLGAGGDMSLEALGDIVMDFTNLRFGSTAMEPLVLGTQLSAFLTTLLAWLSTHTHGNGNNGNPTTPPLVPPVSVVQPQVGQLVSKTVYTV